MDELEYWVPIPGYEEIYEISSHGALRSLGRWATNYTDGRKDRYYPAREMKISIDDVGYPQVGLTRDKIGKIYRVHRLMALAFLPEPLEDQTVVRHLNDIKTDNRKSNLAWGTQVDNSSDMFRNGYQRPRPRVCKRNHPLTGENELVKLDGRRNCRECARAYQYLWYRNGKIAPTEQQFVNFFKEHGYKWLD